MNRRPTTTTILAPAPGERVVVEQILLDPMGRGDRPGFLFLHGLGSVRAGEKSEALLAHARAAGRAFTRFDFRGHGESTGTIGVVTMSELLVDAGLVLDLAGPSILVGSSLGALVAAHLAASRPHDVKGLALLAPAFGFLPRMRQRLDRAGRMQTSEGMSFAVHERALADAARHDESGLPGRLPMPVFLAHGTDDELVPSSLSNAFFNAIPHSDKDLWIVEGGNHRLNREIHEILQRMQALFTRCGL